MMAVQVTTTKEEVMQRRKARLTALVAVGALALAASAQASGPANTSVTIKGQNGDYSGTVSSPHPGKCADQRTITVYKQKGSKQNPSVDIRIGSDTSERHGRQGVWSIGNSGFESGKFYARASKTSSCRSVSSSSIHR
jgi:hypothetical protein